jgi:hypothetical protein
MADNYLQFSEELCDLTDEEVAWWKNVLRPMEEGESAAQRLQRLESIHYASHAADALEEEWPGFQYTLEGNRLWVYAEESGNVDVVAHLMHAFLKAFRPKSTFTLSWAATCSKMRCAQFGGGGFVAHAKGVQWLNVFEWLERNSFLEDKISGAEIDKEV